MLTLPTILLLVMATRTHSSLKEGTWFESKIYGGNWVASLRDSGETRREVVGRSRCYIEGQDIFGLDSTFGALT